MGVQVGGVGAYKIITNGDIVLSLQWLNDEPAMILFPKHRRTLSNGAFCIGLSSAYKYTDVNYLIEQSARCAEVIGFEKSKFIIKRIADTIFDNLQELIEMPPEQMVKPKEKGKVVGEMVLKVDGETVREEDMTEEAA